MWYRYDSGNTIGNKGSEQGITVIDEEHPSGIRITLEKNGFQPFSITCGIYGSFVHTVFSSELSEAESKFNDMKIQLEKIIAIEEYEDYISSIEEFVEAY